MFDKVNSIQTNNITREQWKAFVSDEKVFEKKNLKIKFIQITYISFIKKRLIHIYQKK